MKISCIMPTANRRAFVPLAIRYFLAQDYPDKELIVLDDGEDSVDDLIFHHPQLRYVRTHGRQTVGAKRNLGCEAARGEIIAHWDDDDWYAPTRLSRQAADLLASGADVCGLNRVLFFDPLQRRGFEYVYPQGESPWVYGATLSFRKSFWRRKPFPAANIGEDESFIRNADGDAIRALPNNDIYVGIVHQANTSRKQTQDARWRPRSLEMIRAVIGADWARYATFTGPSGPARTKLRPQPASQALATWRERVSVGIHIADGRGLLATLQALRHNTTLPLEILLLGDGFDASSQQMPAEVQQYRQLSTAAPQGAPACFNRLLQHGGGDVLVFLECGALIGRGALERIVAALYADPRNGLAGPSTNRSWNMQQAFPNATADDIQTTARLASAVYGNTYRTMEPLYCLADFCYALKRQVATTIGAADETYGEGPCWEMDYSVRAVRSGFRTIWAQGAYVFRAPVSTRRGHIEAQRFDISKQLYQDRFCAKRLRGEPGSYHSHCRGEECRYFAPPELIRCRLPFAADASPPATSGAARAARTPLVSCLTPTANRRSFLPLALQCFQTQDYPNKELIVIDDGDEPIADLLRSHPQVRHLRLCGPHSIGHKRNLGCEAARGEIIMHWDDDDWYGPQRISQQVLPIVAGEAELSGLETRWILDLLAGAFWTVSPELHRQMFVADVSGGTLAFARGVWERGVRYPDVSLAEDAAFLQSALLLGMRLLRVPNAGLYVYNRHPWNTWRFAAGTFLNSALWARTTAPPMLQPDIVASYRQAAGALAARVDSTLDEQREQR